MPGESFLHRLDPRAKLAIIGLAMVAVFLLSNPWLLLTLGVGALALGVGARLPLGFMMRGLRFIALLALFSVLCNAFLTPGEIVWEWGPLQLTWEGVERGIAMGLRLVLLVLLTSLLSLTTSPIMLCDALESLLSPGKVVGVPAHELAMVSTIALRFVPTLVQELERIIKAQLARGAALDRGNLWQRARALLPIMVPLFVSAFRHAEDLAWAMEARCYRGGEGRTHLRQLRWGWRDSGAVVGAALILILLKGGELYWGRGGS